jgi:hypothetical protein
LPTTDARFAQEVEQKVSSLLAGLRRRAAVSGATQIIGNHQAIILFERKIPHWFVSDMPP